MSAPKEQPNPMQSGSLAVCFFILFVCLWFICVFSDFFTVLIVFGVSGFHVQAIRHESYRQNRSVLCSVSCLPLLVLLVHVCCSLFVFAFLLQSPLCLLMLSSERNVCWLFVSLVDCRHGEKYNRSRQRRCGIPFNSASQNQRAETRKHHLGVLISSFFCGFCACFAFVFVVRLCIFVVFALCSVFCAHCFVYRSAGKKPSQLAKSPTSPKAADEKKSWNFDVWQHVCLNSNSDSWFRCFEFEFVLFMSCLFAVVTVFSSLSCSQIRNPTWDLGLECVFVAVRIRLRIARNPWP